MEHQKIDVNSLYVLKREGERGKKESFCSAILCFWITFLKKYVFNIFVIPFSSSKGCFASKLTA